VQARPFCLPTPLQDQAEAMYLLYLFSLREDLQAGRTNTVSGPVTSEREGDIAVSYADLTRTDATLKPASDPWTQWHLLWMRCARGAITSRFGDPVRQGSGRAVSDALAAAAIAVWQG